MHWVFGLYELNIATRELRYAGEVVPLEPKAFNVLVYLVTHRNRAVTKSELLEVLWPGEFVTEAALTRSVRLIRQALRTGGHGPGVIKTLRGYGYRFVAEVIAYTGDSLNASPFDVSNSTPVVECLMPPAAATPTTTEPRQLTSLSCEVVDMDMLIAALDLEDLHALMHEFHVICDAIMARFEGFLAYRTERCLGVYFGYPQTHDDDALRAVRAALRLMAAMPTLATVNTSVPLRQLSVRIGIHTGMVVMESRVEKAHLAAQAIGDAPTVARGLQQQAAPNTVLVSEMTAQLVRDAVKWEPLGLYLGASSSRDLNVYRILSERLF
jgi:DNA-binding winged helix-turn-helix (wHTH) protein